MTETRTPDAFRREPLDFRLSLLRAFVLLTVLTSGAILVATVLGAYSAVGDLSRSLIDSTSLRTSEELNRFFGKVRSSVETARGWGERGLLGTDDPERLNRLLIPLLSATPQISSALVGSDLGDEYLLLRDGETWRNRLVRREEWGRRTRWLRWSRAGDLLEDSWEETEYDPRQRPWFQGAAGLADSSQLHWTAPYAFFTTKQPGITVSAPWRGASEPDVLRVVAFDVLLLDISRFTTRLQVTEHGCAAVLTPDGRTVGLPRSRDSETDATLESQILRPVVDLGVDGVGKGFGEWVRAGYPSAPLRFFDRDGSWWAGFREFPLNGDQRFWIGVLVPEGDFLAETRRVRDRVVLISTIAIGLAVTLAFWLDHGFRKKISAAMAHARQLGQYTVEQELGAGGMGTVYKARHDLLQRTTAVKLLRSDRELSDEALARFEREVRLTSRLSHPCTVTIFDYGKTPEGIFYYAMEYLDGLNLGRLVATTGPQPPSRVVHVLRQVCGSLAEAHAAGLIHRDIKPENIILCRHGWIHDPVKVVDFGLVKDVSDSSAATSLSMGDVVRGTPFWMSPEQCSPGGEVDGRSALYSLGCVGYFLLTGTRPFEGDSVLDVFLKHREQPPQKPSDRLGAPLPATLEGMILRCLSKSRDDRPPSAEALAGELDGLEGVSPWTREDAARWWSRHPNIG